jgi:hypothetical protein
MQTPAPFDLNAAIAGWRQALHRQTAMRAQERDELESHLRDATADWQARGLSPAEAFAVARHRLGEPLDLGEEFGRAHPERVWLERAVWILVGAGLLMQPFGLASAISIWISAILNVVALPSWAVVPMLLMLRYGVLAALAACLWRALRRPEQRARLARWTLRQPFWTASALIAVTAVLPAASDLLSNAAVRWPLPPDGMRHLMEAWGVAGLLTRGLHVVALSIGLVWLARRWLQARATA